MEKISVVTTTFNDEKMIISFLNQLTKQTVQPSEIIIVDGGSKDETVQTINRYAQNCPINILVISDGKRRNIAQGFNDAVKNTHNKWVLVIGTGNNYKADFVEKMLKAKQDTHAKVFYSTIIGCTTSRFGYWFNQYFLRGNRIQDLDISNHGMLIDKNVFEQIGYFWESFIYAGEDFEFSRRVHNHKIETYWVKDAVAYWDTPQTWKDYKKKMYVNSIADWQIEDSQIIIRRSVIQLIALIFYILFVAFKPSLLFFLPLLLIFIGTKKNTNSIPAIILGIFNRYLMIWYYFKNRKYKDSMYHISLEYQIKK